ncbi:MAG: ABC transporter transmembrane domain-containing protein [Nitrosomonas sp.]
MMYFYQIYRSLIQKLTLQWKLILLLLFVFLMGAIIIALFPIAIQYLLSNILAEKNWELVQQSLLMILALGAARAIVNFLGDYLTDKISSRFGVNFHREILDKLLTLSIRQLEDFSQQKKMSALFRNAIQINLVTVEKLILLVKEFFIILGLGACIAYLHPSFLLLSLLLTAALIFVNQIASDQLKRVNEEYRESFNNLIDYPIESIQYYKEIKLYQGQSCESHRFSKTVVSIFEKNRHKTIVKLIIRFLEEILAVCMIILSLYLLTLDIVHTGSDVAEMIALVAATVLLFLSMRKIGNSVVELKIDTKHLEKVFSFLEQASDIDMGTQPLTVVQGKLRFEQLQWGHMNQRMCLLDLTIQPGEKIVFTNYSVVAKNELIDLILRFQTSASGNIWLDDRLLQDIKVADFYTNVAFISQNSLWLDDTIAGNIAYGTLRCANEAEITSATQKSGATTFIKKMPRGLQTKVDEVGIKIQKLERIHIAIARALLKKPAIIILDEIFDREVFNNETIFQAFRTLTANRTTLIFSQTLEHLIDHDRIILLDQRVKIRDC